MSYIDDEKAMYEKYDYAVKAISVANNVDMGVAKSMLESNVNRGGHYPYVNEEEFKKDWENLTAK